MYRAFIIDDDKLAAEVTYMMFPWDELNVSKIDKIYTTTGLVDKILTEQPHVVFIDIEMGDISGLDIIKECKEKDCDSLFVIVSGHDNFKYAHTAVNLGAIHYLLKPIDDSDVEVLTEKLKKILLKHDRYDVTEENPENANELWKKILDYIEKNYTKKIQAQDVCSELYISIRTLYNISVANSNKSFSEYLTHFRIAKAKQLLLNTSIPIPEIADKIGIKDHYYFIKVFKKHTGITPVKFRSEGGRTDNAAQNEN